MEALRYLPPSCELPFAFQLLFALGLMTAFASSPATRTPRSSSCAEHAKRGDGQRLHAHSSCVPLDFIVDERSDNMALEVLPSSCHLHWYSQFLGLDLNRPSEQRAAGGFNLGFFRLCC